LGNRRAVFESADRSHAIARVRRDGLISMKVALERDVIRIGDRFAVSFQRTLRVPDDGREYPLPASLGRFPVRAVSASTFLVPLHAREALWLGFDSTPWKPHAVQVGIGGINAVSGRSWNERLCADPQDYLVCPPQLWLDGINAGSEHIRQFVAMPMGEGLTVEAQLTGVEEHGGIRITVFDAVAARFPDASAPARPGTPMAMPDGSSMGVGAGGRIRQKIYPDPHGLDAWDHTSRTSVLVHLVNSATFERLTSEPAPPSPIDVRTYEKYGVPWFDLSDDALGDVDAPSELSRVKSIEELEQRRGARKERD
jgi:hypothetical protein